jgi:hypothetical protein
MALHRGEQRGHLIAESDRHRLLQSACEVTGYPKSICSRLINRDHGLADFGSARETDPIKKIKKFQRSR